ncbi:hypothetical protein O3M35_003139 [Rhynocoris fuscipes]|uniref:DNA replication complex GINS protein SLD5 n=2 Tax=Rhynocoris fuscipes TaxID=488301 RepID=A0AAW1CJ44_9HEMI
MLCCLILTFSICLTALLGDAILNVIRLPISRAFTDSLTHGLIGLITWIVVVQLYRGKFLVSKTFEVILSGFIASAIDVDHFIYNRSFDINEALHLGEHRPIFHSTSLLIVSTVVPYIFSLIRYQAIFFPLFVAEMSLETFLNEIEDGVDGEEDEVLTAAAVLQILNEAWINEKLSPELLPHKSEYVEVMMEQITQMEENVSRLNPTDLRNLIHRQELERIRYLIRSYLRIRLAKIEKYSLSLFNTRDIMSAEETDYLREYLALSVEPLKSLCDRMSGPIGNLNPKQIEISPDLETHVFIKSKCDLTEALIVNDDEIVLKEGSQHIIPYSVVREHIKENRVFLI